MGWGTQRAAGVDLGQGHECSGRKYLHRLPWGSNASC